MPTYTYDYLLAVNQAGDPQENITFTFYSDVAATTLVAITDLNGTPLTNLVSSASGIVGRFQSTITRGYLKSGSLVLPILSVEAQDGATAAASAADAATSAAASATAAALATTNLGASISSAISNDPTLLASIKGAKGDGGPGPYAEWLALGNTGNYAAFASAVLTGPQGDAGPSVTSYTPPWDLGLAVGYISPYVRVPAAAINGIKLTATQVNLDQTTTVAAKVQILKKVGTTVTNLLATGSEATVTTGASEVYLPLTSVTVPAGASFAVKVIALPSTGGGSSTADDSIVATTQYGDGLTTTANSHPLTLPSGGASGDKVLVFVPEQSNNTVVKMADARFAEVKRTLQSTLSGVIFAADWASDLSCTIRTFDNTDGVTPQNRACVAVAVLKRGSSSPFQQADLAGAAGAVRTGPTVTEASPTAFGLAVDFYRTPADVATTFAVTSGPAGASALRTPQSAHATLVNVGVNVRSVPGVAGGGNYTPTTYTLTQTGGLGAVASAVQISGYVGFQKGNTVTGVTRMSAFVEFERI